MNIKKKRKLIPDFFLVKKEKYKNSENNEKGNFLKKVLNQMGGHKLNISMGEDDEKNKDENNIINRNKENQNLYGQISKLNMEIQVMNQTFNTLKNCNKMENTNIIRKYKMIMKNKLYTSLDIAIESRMLI